MINTTLMTEVVVHVALYSMAATLVGRLGNLFDGTSRRQYALAIGAVLGITAVIGMTAPVTIADGVVFDGRAIAIASAGLFGGPAAAFVSIIPPALYRIDLGGAGVLPAMVNLLLAGALGAVIRRAALKRASAVDIRDVVAAAVLLPFTSYLAFPFFPTLELGWTVFQNVGLALAIVMPPGLMFVGLLLIDEDRRQRLVANLRSKESLFDALHADIPAMVFQRTLSKDGLPAFRFVSASCRRMLDRTPEELCSNPKAFIEAIHPDDREQFLKVVQDAEKVGVLPMHEYRSISRDGVVRWLRVNAAAVNVDGEYVWNGVTIDVTKFKEIEQKERELAQLVSHSEIAILRVDPEFKIEYFNAAAERLYGYRADEVIGMPAAMFRPPEMVDHMTPLLDELRQYGRAGSIRTESLHKSGRRIPTRIDLSPLRNDVGEVIGWAAMCLDMSEQARVEQELHRLAATDALTELPNRRSFQERAAREIDRARRYKRPIAVVMADIDHFKRINDEFGHSAGDVVLHEVAEIFRHTLRSSGDLVARMGGEEFAMLLPESNAAGAEHLAERLRLAVETMEFAHKGRVMPVRCSFGVAEWHPAEDSMDAAMQRADAALYGAKAGGRNRVLMSERPRSAASAL